MAKTIAESMKDLTALEKGYIKDICTTAKSDLIISIRKLQHINNYLITRGSQVSALAQKLKDHLSISDFESKFDGFDSIGRKYMMDASDFGDTLAITKDILYDEIKKDREYAKEEAELTKNSASISFYLLTTLPAFKKKLQEIIDA